MAEYGRVGSAADYAYPSKVETANDKVLRLLKGKEQSLTDHKESLSKKIADFATTLRVVGTIETTNTESTLIASTLVNRETELQAEVEKVETQIAAVKTTIALLNEQPQTGN